MNAGSSLIDARPHVLPSQTTRIATALGTAFVTISRDSSHQPMEVFVSVGKAGSETFAAAEALGRLVSLALRLDSSVPRSARARSRLN
jgi:ribonucleoside-diphosphate reductase alpha chain